MKKIISLLLVAIMIIGVCAVSASAALPAMGYIGDADDSGIIDVADATYIQRMLASLVEFDAEDELYADVDLDKNITILDATEIQMWIAKLLPVEHSHIGGYYSYAMREDDFYSDYLSGQAMAGVPVTFTANLIADSPMQNYELYVNGELVASSEDSNSLTYTFPEAGFYDVVMYANAFYGKGEFRQTFKVVENDGDNKLAVKSFYSTGKYWGDYVYDRQGIKFYAEAMGGTAPYRYEFIFKRQKFPYTEDSPKVYVIQNYSENNCFELPEVKAAEVYGEYFVGFYDDLECKVQVNIMDANGDVVTQTEKFYITDYKIG